MLRSAFGRLHLPGATILRWLDSHVQLRLSILLTYLFGKSVYFAHMMRWAGGMLRYLRIIAQPALVLLGAELHPIAPAMPRVDIVALYMDMRGQGKHMQSKRQQLHAHPQLNSTESVVSFEDRPRVCVVAGPPLQLCQEAAYHYGTLAAELFTSTWTVLGHGARLVLLPAGQALGVAWTALFQLLLPVWQVIRRLAYAFMLCTPQLLLPEDTCINIPL